jgi:hypothetical protein
LVLAVALATTAATVASAAMATSAAILRMQFPPSWNRFQDLGDREGMPDW